MTAIYVALVIYMVVLFGVGLFYSKKNATINDFLLAGRDLGVVAATLTVTAGLLGDIALLCAPAAAFNAAVSAGQESPVYRDDTAARQLYQAVQKLRSLVSMTMLTALQAIDLSDHKAMSPVTQKIHDHARQTVTFMENDDLMYQRIEAMEHLVESNQLLADCSVPFTI